MSKDYDYYNEPCQQCIYRVNNGDHAAPESCGWCQDYGVAHSNIFPGKIVRFWYGQDDGYLYHNYPHPEREYFLNGKSISTKKGAQPPITLQESKSNSSSTSSETENLAIFLVILGALSVIFMPNFILLSLVDRFGYNIEDLFKAMFYFTHYGFIKACLLFAANVLAGIALLYGIGVLNHYIDYKYMDFNDPKIDNSKTYIIYIILLTTFLFYPLYQGKKEITSLRMEKKVDANEQEKEVTLYHHNGSLKYQGQVTDGNIPHGKGIRYFKNGDQYEGEFVNGAMTGFGTYKSNTGSKYIGQLKDNKHHGDGKLYWDNGQINYDGQWENGKRNGQGKVYDRNGKLTYEGEWLNGKSNGHGIYYCQDNEINNIYCAQNEKFEGEYVNDKRNGYGMLYDVDGNVRIEGNWIDGIPE